MNYDAFLIKYEKKQGEGKQEIKYVKTIVKIQNKTETPVFHI